MFVFFSFQHLTVLEWLWWLQKSLYFIWKNNSIKWVHKLHYGKPDFYNVFQWYWNLLLFWGREFLQLSSSQVPSIFQLSFTAWKTCVKYSLLRRTASLNISMMWFFKFFFNSTSDLQNAVLQGTMLICLLSLNLSLDFTSNTPLIFRNFSWVFHSWKKQAFGLLLAIQCSWGNKSYW